MAEYSHLKKNKKKKTGFDPEAVFNMSQLNKQIIFLNNFRHYAGMTHFLHICDSF